MNIKDRKNKGDIIDIPIGMFSMKSISFCAGLTKNIEKFKHMTHPQLITPPIDETKDEFIDREVKELMKLINSTPVPQSLDKHLKRRLEFTYFKAQVDLNKIVMGKLHLEVNEK